MLPRAPQAPFLPEINLKLNKTFTLVLDLDETLIHYDENQSTLSLRPGAESFMKLMNNYYEVVIFTAAT